MRSTQYTGARSWGIACCVRGVVEGSPENSRSDRVSIATGDGPYEARVNPAHPSSITSCWVLWEHVFGTRPCIVAPALFSVRWGLSCRDRGQHRIC